MWKQIAIDNPNVKFYFYTKMPCLTIELSELDNVNQVNSILPDGELNFGSIEYVNELSKKYNAPICPATIKGNDIKCGKDCKICINKNYVLFVIHGNGIK
jgi:hypothetical protein